MMLNEVTAVPGAALPVQALKDHLRLGSGFSDAGMQDALLSGYLRAAMAAIEGRTAKVLIARRFRWVLDAWRWADRQTFPVAPVSAIASVAVVDAAEATQDVGPGVWRLVPDTHRPRIEARGTALPAVPTGGRVEILFDAGFGPAWVDVPPDLQQATLLLAAEYHEQRHEFGLREAGLPLGILSLIERWRIVRTLGGGRA